MLPWSSKAEKKFFFSVFDIKTGMTLLVYSLSTRA